MKKTMKFLLAAAVVVLGMTSCDEFKSFMDNPVGSRLEISETTVTMYNGTTHDLKVSTISDQPITFTSSDERVVTVNAQGVVEAVGVGNATITVSLQGNNIYAAATKEVAVEVLPGMKDALENGAKIGFAFNLNGVDVDYLFENQDGEFTLIPQNMQQGAPRRDAVVSQLIPALLYVETTNTLILSVKQQVGQEQSLVVMVLFNLNDNTIQIIPGSPLTKVLNFKVRIGNVEITASLKKKEVAPTGIILNKSELELEVDQPEALVAYVEPISATDKSVTWTSDKPEVATVDEKGIVTGVAAGEANITAQIGQFSATCKVTVIDGNTYLEWNGTQKQLVATSIPATYTVVEDANANVDWQAGTYVVEGNVTINARIKLLGNVDLIIKDGAKLTVNSYINGNYKKLSIFGQAQMTGELVVNCSGPNDYAITDLPTLEVHSAKVTATASGNNRGGFLNIGTFNVYGGLVDAKNTGWSGFGIRMLSGGSMNIYGGEVKAEGKGNGTLTGCGLYGDDYNNKATVTVYGGKIWSGSAEINAFKNVNLQKGAGFTGKIYTSEDNESWEEYDVAGTPDSKYVKVE